MQCTPGTVVAAMSIEPTSNQLNVGENDQKDIRSISDRNGVYIGMEVGHKTFHSILFLSGIGAHSEIVSSIVVGELCIKNILWLATAQFAC